jgi:hypothetical protein
MGKKVLYTDRASWLQRVKEAGTDFEKCWEGFCDACQELADVAHGSRQFNLREKKAATALELVARMEGGLTVVMRQEFRSQYSILGAPGDFGYGSPEGSCLQAVYCWWNVLVGLERVSQ